MTFVTAAFTLAFFCFCFGALAAWAGNRSGSLPRAILSTYAAAFLFLSLFSVLVGVGFSIELTNQAPCENVINTTCTTCHAQNDTTVYTWVDSCAGRETPESIERLYQAYSTVLLTIILVSVLSLLILGLKAVVFKW